MKILSRDILFEQEILLRDLSIKTSRGSIAVFIAQGVRIVTTFLGTAVLARLLTPADFGSITMVSVFLNLGNVLKEGGLSHATVQSETIDHDKITTLFWVNVAFGSALFLLMLGISPLLPLLYGPKHLTLIAALLSFSFVVSGSGVQHAALLKRHMYFSTLSFVMVVSVVSSTLLAIVLAWRGLGYYALVAQILLDMICQTALHFYYCRWTPGKPSFKQGSRSLLFFGGHVTIFNFFNYCTRNADNFLIGKYLGSSALGLYSRAYNLVLFSVRNLRSPIAQIALPALSRIKDDDKRIRDAAWRFIFLTSFVTMPVMVLFFILADPIVRILLGPKWLDTIPMFKIFAIVGFFNTQAGIKGLLLLSSGKSKQYMQQGIANSIVFVTAYIFGLKWGVEGVAMSFLVSFYAIQIPTFLHTFKHTALDATTVLNALIRPLSTSLVVGGICLPLYDRVCTLTPFFSVALVSLAYLALYLLVFLSTPGGYALIKKELSTAITREKPVPE